MERSRKDCGHMHVMIVDDDRDTATSMADMLTLSGFRATCFTSGRAALLAAVDDPPDVVLLDLAMPGMDGLEVARRMGTPVGGKRPLLFAVTGYGRPADRRRAEAAGIDGLLVKPVAPADIIGTLTRFAEVLRRDGAVCC